MIEQEEFRCFIGNLSWSTSDRDLKDAFKKFGHLLDAKVVLDRTSGRSRGFGFVSFDEEKAMEDAIEAMNGIDLDGRSISVDKAQPNQGGGGRDRDGGGRDRDGGGRDRDGGGRDRDGGGRDRDRDRDRDRGRDRDGGRDRDYGGGGRGGGGDCFKCGKPGHFARECPSGEGSRGGSRYGGRDDRYGGGGGGGGSRYGPDRGGDRNSGSRNRESGSRGGSYGRDRSGPYDR